MKKRLKKSLTDKKFSGVCGGLAEYFDIDSTIVRVIFLAGTVFTIGSPVLIYAILWAVMPN